jgi:trimeric autotransporter adhesin
VTPTATISPPSPATFDRTFHLTSSNPALLAQLPATVTLPAGDDRVSVGLTVPTVSTTTTVTVTASGAGSTVSAVLTLLPPGSPQPAPMLDTIFATPLTVAAGSPSTATIKLHSPAPAGGLVVGLGERLPLSASMPPAVFVPEGSAVATVPITTFIGFPNSTTTVLIEAWAGATLVGNGINVVTGNVTEPLMLNPTTLNAPVVGGIATVVGGTALQGTVSLNGPAPSGGALVTLVSTDTTVATVPASVLIPAGTSAANFTINTKVVATTVSSNVGGGYAGGFSVATLRVTPPSTTTTPSPTPAPTSIGTPSLVSPSADTRFPSGASITFDWTDVSGAATYTIQISDTDKFTSTLVNQTTTASSFTAVGLPTKTLWWRVRATSTSGTTGSFSGARRFELK